MQKQQNNKTTKQQNSLEADPFPDVVVIHNPESVYVLLGIPGLVDIPCLVDGEGVLAAPE